MRTKARVESGSVTWDASLAASTLRNRLDALDGPPVFSLYGASSAGYPIGGYWPRHHTFADANDNRRVDAGEVSVGVE